MPDLSVFLEAEAWLSLATLTLMEIVLGIDNVIFISILSAKLPVAQQPRARRIGLAVALVSRLGLLLTLSWMLHLTKPLFHLFGKGFSARSLILLGGGLFLLAKSAHEIFEKLEVAPEKKSDDEEKKRRQGRFLFVILQVMVLDIVFSLDSVITAVGMSQDLAVMVAAMLLSTVVMVAFAGAVSRFVDRHPSMKILALSFLLLIGVMLVAEGMGQHIDKKYIYFAISFALVVELVNLRVRRRQLDPTHLHSKLEANPKAAPGDGL